MKKIMLLIAMLLVITGCGSKNVVSLDVNKTKSIIENKLSGMEEVDVETLKAVYGFDDVSTSEYIIKQNKDGDIYAIIKTDDKAKTKANMKKYFEKIKQFNASYSPERLAILENRLEKEIGNYLIYIVANNAESIYSEILNTL